MGGGGWAWGLRLRPPAREALQTRRKGLHTTWKRPHRGVGRIALVPYHAPYLFGLSRALVTALLNWSGNSSVQVFLMISLKRSRTR